MLAHLKTLDITMIHSYTGFPPHHHDNHHHHHHFLQDIEEFLDALASLERVMFVGGEFFVRYMIKGFTRLRVTDRNRSLIKQDIWSNKTYRRTTIQPYNLKPYKTYNLTNL